MRVLERMQGLIQRTYALDNAHRVTDFLVTSPALARSLGLAPGDEAPEEQVLVAGDGEAVDLSLYLAAGVLARLEEEDPLEGLHDGNLEPFWTALEGVSHFVYLVWNAGRSRQVTQLELELQAEVDKFVLTVLVVAAQQGRVPAELHRWLFELPRLDARLAPEAARRYLEANRYAERYCRALARRYLSGRDRESMMPELRRFYRLGQRAKLRHIDGTAG